jgi:hypothetical protein
MARQTSIPPSERGTDQKLDAKPLTLMSVWTSSEISRSHFMLGGVGG